jgi:predicted small lipoprotein YifL
MKLCWAQYILWLVITLAGGGTLLSGCGQSGDLYLPDKTESPDKDEK